MSGVSVIRALLVASSGLTDIVPATKIFAGVVPLKTAVPAISVGQVSGTENLTVKMATRPMRVERVQVTVEAASYKQQKEVLELVREACVRGSGNVNGVTLDSILPDGEGPDFMDHDTKVYFQSRDFIVKWFPAA